MDFIDHKFNFNIDYPFNQIYLWLEKQTCEECIEYVVSIMMEPFDEIILPLIKKMSSEEEKFFSIPTDRTVEELVTIIETKYRDILLINFEKKKILKNFGLYQKIKKNQELRIVSRNLVQS